MKVVLFLLLLVTIIFGIFYRLDTIGQGREILTIATKFGSQELKVWVADTPAKRSRGLSGKSRLNDDQGMWFVLNETSGDFWMKDMNFNIDLIFVNSDLRITEIYYDLKPCNKKMICPVFSPTQPASFALEIKSGQAESRGVVVGDQITLEK